MVLQDSDKVLIINYIVSKDINRVIHSGSWGYQQKNPALGGILML